jgi:hypothetical protein
MNPSFNTSGALDGSPDMKLISEPMGLGQNDGNHDLFDELLFGNLFQGIFALLLLPFFSIIFTNNNPHILIFFTI